MKRFYFLGCVLLLASSSQMAHSSQMAYSSQTAYSSRTNTISQGELCQLANLRQLAETGTELDIYSAIDLSCPNIIETLVKEEGVDINQINDHGMAPLHHAVIFFAEIKNASDVIRELVRLGADINIKTSEGWKFWSQGGYTPLHTAVIQKNYYAMHTLLQLGADVNMGSRFGYTSLHLALYFDDLESARILLEHEADPNKPGAGNIVQYSLLLHETPKQMVKNWKMVALLFQYRD